METVGESNHSIVDEHNNTETNWSFHDIDWRFVFYYQHYGSLLFTFIPILILASILWVFSEEPELDAELSLILANQDYNYAKKAGSIPAVVAVLVPFFIFFFILCLGELCFLRQHHGNITNAVYCIVYFFVDWFCAFAVQIFCQQVSAIVVAEPRPDYASRCQVDASGQCSKDDDDGLRSYFSGHASSAILSAVYCSIYLLWTAYWRRNHTNEVATAASKHKQIRRYRLLEELSHGAVLYLIVVQLGFAWIVGVSRITDNRHHIWDVITGYFVGSVVATFFVLHAIGVLPSMPKKSTCTHHDPNP